VDPEGAPVYGWFTRRGNEVTFDDFLVFVDHFGRSQGDPDFDPVVDIVENGAIDFDDFLLFVEDFGKTVANAAIIQEQLGF